MQVVPAPPPLRLFLALWPGPAAAAAALAWQRAQPWPAGARLVDPGHLHVTLHYLGNVPVDRLVEVARGLAVPARRITLTLQRLAVWQQGATVLVADTVPAALSDLHGTLALRLRVLGLPVETRPYRPHCTLARHAAGLAAAMAPPVRWTTARYVLVASRGGLYTPVHWYRA